MTGTALFPFAFRAAPPCEVWKETDCWFVRCDDGFRYGIGYDERLSVALAHALLDLKGLDND